MVGGRGSYAAPFVAIDGPVCKRPSRRADRAMVWWPAKLLEKASKRPIPVGLLCCACGLRSRERVHPWTAPQPTPISYVTISPEKPQLTTPLSRIHKSPISKDSIDSETRQISSGSSDVWSEITPESVPPTPVITEPQPPIEDDVDFRPNTAAEVAFREKLTECRLSRSQADLNDMDLDAARKALSSAPPKQR